MSESFFSRFNPLTGSYRRGKPLSVRGAETAIDFSPLAAVKTGQEIYEESQSEDPSLLKMGIMAAGEAAGLIPVAGPAVKTMVRRVPADLADEIAGLNRRSVDTEINNYRLNLERNTDLSPDEIDVRVENYASKQEGSVPAPVRDLTETEKLADEIAADLRAGKTDLVTDERLDELDFLGEIRLRQHYIEGNVGVDADGVPITLDNAEREARMLAQGYERVGVHGTKIKEDGVRVDDIRVLRPSTQGKSGRGVYLDVEPTGMDFGDGEIVNPAGTPYPTANQAAGYYVDPSSIDQGKGAAKRIPEGSQMYPLVQRGPFAKSTDYTAARREILKDDPDISTVELNRLANRRLMDQGFTGIDSKHYGEITSFEGGNLRAPTAVFDPRLTNLKNIGMADGGAVMNGIGTLNETARNMFRGPRGIGAYQQYAMGGEASGPPPMRGPDPQGVARYAPGGPVESIRPQARPESVPEFSAPLTSLRPQPRPESYEEKFFEINSTLDERDGFEKPVIKFKDGAKMFLTDVENMINGNKSASEPVVGKSTAEEVLEFLQEKNPTSQEFLNYFSSARLADGGPVYMSQGGVPDEVAARRASTEDLANLAQMIRENYGFDPVAVALEQGVDPELALRVMYEESKGKQSAGSEKGARGLMQLMPGTAEELGVDINDALDNYTGGLKYLKQMTNQFGLEVGLAAYNAGPGNVAEYQGIPPFKETQNYVRIIAEPFTGNSVEGLINTGAENFMMNQPVFSAEDVARGRGVRPMSRPPEIEFSAPLTSLRPQARPNPTPEMQPEIRPLALPEGQSMIEKYGLPGDMPQGGIMSASR